MKCLWPGVRDGADATLLNEVLILGKLRHPNSCALWGCGLRARARLFPPTHPRPAVLAVYAVQLQPRTMLVMELGAGGRREAAAFGAVFEGFLHLSLNLQVPSAPHSLDALLARTSLVTFNWPQRVVMGAGVASGVACASAKNWGHTSDRS